MTFIYTLHCCSSIYVHSHEFVCLSFKWPFHMTLYFGLSPLTESSWAPPFILTDEGKLVHVNANQE